MVRTPRVSLLEQTTGALNGDVLLSACLTLSASGFARSSHACTTCAGLTWTWHRGQICIVAGSGCFWCAATLRPLTLPLLLSRLLVKSQRRGAHPAHPLRSFLYHPGHPRWSQVLIGCLRNDAGPRRHGVKWRQRCHALRDQWRRSGFPWADGHPLAGAALWGCAKTTRGIEVLEVSLLRACWKKGVDPRRPEELLEAKKGDMVRLLAELPYRTPGWPRYCAHRNLPV